MAKTNSCASLKMTWRERGERWRGGEREREGEREGGREGGYNLRMYIVCMHVQWFVCACACTHVCMS